MWCTRIFLQYTKTTLKCLLASFVTGNWLQIFKTLHDLQWLSYYAVHYNMEHWYAFMGGESGNEQSVLVFRVV